MAKSDRLPGFRDKRRVLFGRKTAAEQMREAGGQFMQAERYDDALEFFARCDAESQVQQIARIAVERGDTPLLLRARVVLKEQPTQEELVAVARKAKAAGRKSMARLAYLKAGLEQEAERLGAELAGEPEPEAGEQSRAAGTQAPPQESEGS